MLRYIHVFLALAAALAAFTSCSSEEVEAQSTEAANTEQTVVETVEPSEPETTPIPFDKAKVKGFSTEIGRLDQEYKKAFAAKDLNHFMKLESSGEALVKRLETIEMIGLPHHPAYHCRQAAIYLTTSRGIAWVTLNSKSPTDTDKRIDAANLAEAEQAIKDCSAAAQAK